MLNFSSLFMECNAILFNGFLCFIICKSSGSLLLSLWLGEPEDGAVRVSLLLNVMFVNCCIDCIQKIYVYILYKTTHPCHH